MKTKASQASLDSNLVPPPERYTEMPSPDQLLNDAEVAPAITGGLNIFPFDWRVETPRLAEIYDQSRDPGWSPSKLPWHTLDVSKMTLDQATPSLTGLPFSPSSTRRGPPFSPAP